MLYVLLKASIRQGLGVVEVGERLHKNVSRSITTLEGHAMFTPIGYSTT